MSSGRAETAGNIREEDLKSLNLEWEDYRRIDPERWAETEDPGVKIVFNTGEKLYRPSQPGGEAG